MANVRSAGQVKQAALTVLDTVEALHHAAAAHFVEASSAAISTSGAFKVAFSGGETQRSLYALLASDPYARQIDWPRVHVFWSDERCVPAHAPQSHYGMAREALLAHVPLVAAHVHPMRGEGDASQAAQAYERELRTAFATILGPPRTKPGSRLDLVLLELGADGQTASLFPKGKAVREVTRWVVPEYVASASMWCLTLTPPVINAAAQVTFLVAGAQKAAALLRAQKAPRAPDAFPAHAIAPTAGGLRFLVDAAAAAELHTP